MKKVIILVFLFLSIVLVADCILYYFYQISFAGYYSDIVVFWLWFFTSIIVIVLFWRRLMAKLFFISMLLALIGSVLPMMIPFYALLLSITSSGLKLDKNLNSKYRSQIVGYIIMTRPRFELIEKKGILEIKIWHCSDMDFQNFKNDAIDDEFKAKLRSEVTFTDAKDIIFESETAHNLTLKLYYEQYNKVITFDKKTKEITQIK